jgi:hypothetical protein
MELKQQLATNKSRANPWINTTIKKMNTIPLAPTTTKDVKLRKNKM